MSEKYPYETGDSPDRRGNRQLPVPVERGKFFKYDRDGISLPISEGENVQLQSNLTAHGIGQCAVGACGSRLIYPVAWEELPKKNKLDDKEEYRYRIECRCPECEMFVVLDAPQSEVEIFDDQLNEGTEDLLITLRNVTRSNMKDFVETFARLIHDDHILPEDF